MKNSPRRKEKEGGRRKREKEKVRACGARPRRVRARLEARQPRRLPRGERKVEVRQHETLVSYRHVSLWNRRHTPRDSGLSFTPKRKLHKNGLEKSASEKWTGWLPVHFAVEALQLYQFLFFYHCLDVINPFYTCAPGVRKRHNFTLHFDEVEFPVQSGLREGSLTPTFHPIRVDCNFLVPESMMLSF